MTDTTRGAAALIEEILTVAIQRELDTEDANQDPGHECPTCYMQPGSRTARDAGCICPVLDNGHGHAYRMVYRLDCPVEHPTREDQP